MRTRTALRICSLTSLLVAGTASARGVTPYLPLNLAPDIERQIERVLILADKPVMRRPIAAATVLDALPKACEIDAVLCQRVRDYLRKFMGERGITQARGTIALTDGDSQQVVPNEHGMRVDSPWNISTSAYNQINDYILVNGGLVAYEGRTVPTGSFVSLGFSYAQLDIGYRDHWFSPLSDSSMLISTEAPTMPSITLSNYEPITKLGLSYEVFLAQMSKQNGIQYFNGVTSGYPLLAGLQTMVEPVSGYALSVNRVFQYGGGAREKGFSQFVDAVFKNSNEPDIAGQSSEFGNQAASITSSITFPGPVPFAVHVEYAGDDNAYAGHFRLGKTNLSLGIDFPHLWNRFDVSFEVSDWQETWYVNHLYPEGLANERIVIGHWMGDARQFGNSHVFGTSQSLALGAQLPRGYVRARYRTLANEALDSMAYERAHDLSLSYATSFLDRPVEAELHGGRDVFGDTYLRLGLTVDLIQNRTDVARSLDESSDERISEYFVDAGLSYMRAYQIIAHSIPRAWTEEEIAPHIGVGARRKVSARNDIGVRLEFDKLAGQQLISVRALDYRYRFNQHLAASAFFGFGRYKINTLPAYGYYWGGGLQWIDALRGWDVGLDYRMNDKLTREKVLTSDPLQAEGGGYFIDSRGALLYVSYRF